MKLVVDANIIFSAIISSKGKTRNLIFSDETELTAPEFLLKEFEKHKQEITEKSELPEEDLKLALSLISSKIKFIPFNEFKETIPKAKEVCPDPDDVEYFALSLSKDIPFWSNDKKLKKQKDVKLISTKELLSKLEKKKKLIEDDKKESEDSKVPEKQSNNSD